MPMLQALSTTVEDTAIPKISYALNFGQNFVRK